MAQRCGCCWEGRMLAGRFAGISVVKPRSATRPPPPCICQSLMRCLAPSPPRWTLGWHVGPWLVLSLLSGSRSPMWRRLLSGPLLWVLSEDHENSWAWSSALRFYVGHQLCSLPFAEGLNADYVKGENLEAVVCEEPQGEAVRALVSCYRAASQWAAR